jgi:hypothetical protein
VADKAGDVIRDAYVDAAVPDGLVEDEHNLLEWARTGLASEGRELGFEERDVDGRG